MLYGAPVSAGASVDVEMVSSAVTSMEHDLDTVVAAESTARTENEDVPAVVGVPETTPLSEAILKPAGNVPLSIDHAYGLCPPTADIVEVYAWLTLARGPGQDGIANPVPTRIMSGRCVCPFTESSTCKVKVKRPGCVG